MPEHTTLQMSFVDEATGLTFDDTQMPLERLPDDLEGMTLHMGEDAYAG